MEPNCRCIVHRNGKDTILVSTFDWKGFPERWIEAMIPKPTNAAGDPLPVSSSSKAATGQPTSSQLDVMKP